MNYFLGFITFPISDTPSSCQLFLSIRFTTTFVITSFSSVRLSAIISVRATNALLSKRREQSGRSRCSRSPRNAAMRLLPSLNSGSWPSGRADWPPFPQLSNIYKYTKTLEHNGFGHIIRSRLKILRIRFFAGDCEPRTAPQGDKAAPQIPLNRPEG